MSITKDFENYNLKRQIDLNESQVSVTVVSPDIDQFIGQNSSCIQLLHGVNKKQVIKRRRKNKQAHLSRIRNKK